MKSENLQSDLLSETALTTMARFLVLPGADRLLAAYAAIPPGPMREALINLAETHAGQYLGAPPEYAAPDPLLVAARTAPLPGPLIEGPSPARREVPKVAAGPEGDVIKLRKQGVHPQQIVEQTGVARKTVVNIIAAAKKAGIPFPSIREAKSRPMEKKQFITDEKQLSAQGLWQIEKVAAKYGITVAEYLARKKRAVELAQDGADYQTMMTALGFDRKMVSLILSNARAAGISIPYIPNVHRSDAEEPDAPAPAEPPVSNVVKVSRFFGNFTTMDTRAQYAVKQAAARRDLTPQAYLDLREKIVRQRMQGIGPRVIAEQVGQSEIFVKDTIAEAKAKGAEYPPTPRGWAVRRAAS